MNILCKLFGLWCATVVLPSQAEGPIPAFKLQTPQEFHFMEVHVIDHGVVANERFFLGRLPEEGEAVEMVYVGKRENGAMRFQLRVRSAHD